MSEKLETIATAFALAQAEFPRISKDTTVSVQSRSGGGYSFDYAPLDHIMRLIQPVLSAHGLSILQDCSGDEGCVLVSTTVLHTSAERLRSSPTRWPIPPGADAKAIGSAITYARRYSLCAWLNLTPEREDDDAGAAMGDRTTVVPTRTPTRLAAPPVTAPPPGAVYVNRVDKHGDWWDVTFTDATGAPDPTEWSTKIDEIGELALQLLAAGVPVKPEGRPKKDPTKGFFLNRITKDDGVREHSVF